MITFTEMLSALNATWREQPRRVRVLAARYYIGAETADSLRELTKPQHCAVENQLMPLLTESQVNHIIMMR